MEIQLLDLLLTFCCVFTRSSTQTVQDVKDLRTQLFTTNGYDYRVRPVANQSEPIYIYITFNLLNLNELNEVEETMKTTGFLVLRWSDSELTWSPATYGGITTAYFPQDDVWKPDLALMNSYTDYKDLGSSKLNVFVSYTGVVYWYPFQVFTSTCSMDITDYPFDVQTCALTFVAWSYDQTEVVLYGLNHPIDLSEYEGNPVWSIIGTKYELDADDASITFLIKLKRKSTFTVLFVVLPIIMLAVANLFVFVLPCESGERAGYAVTAFLAFAVFLTLVEASLPKSSDNVSLFSVYIMTMTAQSTVITLIAQGMLRLTTFNHETTAVPRWLVWLSNLGRLKPCKTFKQSSKVNIDPENKAQEVDEDMHVNTAEEETEEVNSWKEVINGLDAFCFMFFSVETFLVTVICLSVSAGRAAAIQYDDISL